MMLSKYKTIGFILITGLSSFKAIAQTDVASAFKFATSQTDFMLTQVVQAKAQTTNANLVVPRNIDKNGNLNIIASKDWCSGFFPGELWYLYEYTKDTKWLNEAKTYTAFIEQEKFNTGTHDLGFEIYCSFGNAYRLTHDAAYKDVIIQGARSLSKRFNPIVGAIRSWGNIGTPKFTVIVDNMMNLELLFEATHLSGDSSFYKIAVTHANTTIKNHFRADNSSYHVVNYDQETGKVIEKITAQGYANESAWARGQAWGLYGYTMCYRETKDKRYLEQAEKIAQFIINNPELPKDLIPYWDYNAPDKATQSRDASAGAIAASALYELGTYSKTNGKLYTSTANKIVDNLKAYRPNIGESKGFLLLHSTGSAPAHSEVDVPIIYADYYYLEALIRKQRLHDHQPVIKQ
jgi:unsaturated chondroitin disaccharide hydrolase